MTVEIVILAMIAAFLGLRLYSVLGRKAEHDDEMIARRLESPAQPTRTLPSPAQHTDDSLPQGHANQPQSLPVASPLVEGSLHAIASADRHFDPHAFLDGARGAYKMILEAFWSGNREDLKQLCTQDVFNGFAAAIDSREAAGETLNNRLVRINDLMIQDASFNAPEARITLRFHSDIAAVTRDAGGNVIAGSLDDAIEANDVWTFVRNVRSDSPDWLLEATDEG